MRDVTASIVTCFPSPRAYAPVRKAKNIRITTDPEKSQGRFRPSHLEVRLAKTKTARRISTKESAFPIPTFSL
jgi:hypothetical protein